SGRSCLDGYLSGFVIPDFTDHENVWILTQERAESGGKRVSFRFIHLRLEKSRDLVFDRIFDGDDLYFRFVDAGKNTIESRGLSGTGRPGIQDDPVRFFNSREDLSKILFSDMKRFQIQFRVGLIEQSHDDRFAVAA